MDEKEGLPGTAFQGSPPKASAWACWQYDLEEEQRQQENSCSECISLAQRQADIVISQKHDTKETKQKKTQIKKELETQMKLHHTTNCTKPPLQVAMSASVIIDEIVSKSRDPAFQCSDAMRRRARGKEAKKETSDADRPASGVQEHEVEFWPFGQEAQDLQQPSVRSAAISKSKENKDGKIWARDDEQYGHQNKIAKGSYCVLYHKRDETHSAQQDPLAPEHPMSLCKVLELTNLRVKVEWLVEARDPSRRQPAPMLQGQYTQYSKIYTKTGWDARVKKAQTLAAQAKGTKKVSRKKPNDNVASHSKITSKQPTRQQPPRGAQTKTAQVVAGGKRSRARTTPPKQTPNKTQKKKPRLPTTKASKGVARTLELETTKENSDDSDTEEGDQENASDDSSYEPSSADEDDDSGTEDEASDGSNGDHHLDINHQAVSPVGKELDDASVQHEAEDAPVGMWVGPNNKFAYVETFSREEFDPLHVFPRLTDKRKIHDKHLRVISSDPRSCLRRNPEKHGASYIVIQLHEDQRRLEALDQDRCLPADRDYQGQLDARGYMSDKKDLMQSCTGAKPTTVPRKALNERQRQSLPGVAARLANQRQRRQRQVFSSKKNAKKGPGKSVSSTS